MVFPWLKSTVSTKVKALYRRAHARIGPASAVDADRDAAIQAGMSQADPEPQESSDNRWIQVTESQQIVKDIASWMMIACILKRNQLTIQMALSICGVPLDGRNKRESFWCFFQLDCYLHVAISSTFSQPGQGLAGRSQTRTWRQGGTHGVHVRGVWKRCILFSTVVTVQRWKNQNQKEPRGECGTWERFYPLDYIQ